MFFIKFNQHFQYYFSVHLNFLFFTLYLKISCEFHSLIIFIRKIYFTLFNKFLLTRFRQLNDILIIYCRWYKYQKTELHFYFILRRRGFLCANYNNNLFQRGVINIAHFFFNAIFNFEVQFKKKENK